MPVAVVIGWDQTLFLAASTPVNHPEYELAGSLRGAPVELVKCETSDLMVPASAEIVIEGFISPDRKPMSRKVRSANTPVTMPEAKHQSMRYASSALVTATIPSFMAV
jgi:hypothetical protein